MSCDITTHNTTGVTGTASSAQLKTYATKYSDSPLLAPSAEGNVLLSGTTSLQLRKGEADGSEGNHCVASAGRVQMVVASLSEWIRQECSDQPGITRGMGAQVGTETAA